MVFHHIFEKYAQVKLDHETPNFPGENKNSLKPPSSKWPKQRLLRCFIIHPQKNTEKRCICCFLVFCCVWQVLCSCLGGKEKWREDFLGLTTNDKWFVFPAIFDGQRVQINSLEILCRGIVKGGSWPVLETPRNPKRKRLPY